MSPSAYSMATQMVLQMRIGFHIRQGRRLAQGNRMTGVQRVSGHQWMACKASGRSQYVRKKNAMRATQNPERFDRRAGAESLLGSSIAGLVRCQNLQESHELALQIDETLVGDKPNCLQLNPKIVVDQFVAHACNPTPFDLGG